MGWMYPSSGLHGKAQWVPWAVQECLGSAWEGLQEPMAMGVTGHQQLCREAAGFGCSNRAGVVLSKRRSLCVAAAIQQSSICLQ